MSFIEFGKTGEGGATSLSEEWDKCRKYIRGDVPLLNIFKLPFKNYVYKFQSSKHCLLY